MRHITDTGKKLIEVFEGFFPLPYICPAGYLTVGYGHRVLPGENFSTGISKDQAEDILEKDVGIAERAVEKYITVPLTDAQFDALVSFTFNVGAGRLQRSTLRMVLNRGEYAKVPDQLKLWVTSNGKKLPGLIKRRAMEADLFSAKVVLSDTPPVPSPRQSTVLFVHPQPSGVRR